MSCDKLFVHYKNHGDMSFKDLTTFNVAMIGTQEWKFLNESISILFCVFKVRYFPTSTYLGSKLRHNLSYVW
jgi:hypothetical protein